MTKRAVLSLLAVVIVATPLFAAKVPMPPAPQLELAGTPQPLVAALTVPDELATLEHVVKTSPFDRLKYATGAFTVELFRRNLPLVFNEVVEGQPADVTVSLELVRFEATVPHPAYKPYTATAVYRVVVADQDGEVLLTQTATGQGQTSKGMMSGFKAKQLCAEAAKQAMADAATQALEGLLDAPELRELATH